jgi:hypothetical protein
MISQHQPHVFYRCVGLVILALLVFQIFETRSIAQQNQPNFAGEWKLNAQKSKSTTWFRSEVPDVLDIRHSGLKLKMRHPFSPLGDRDIYSYVIDGNERVANVSATGVVFKGKAYWDGNTVVIERHQQATDNDQPIEWFWRSRYSMSADGKVLVVDNERPGDPNSDFQSELIYEKQ